MPVIGVQHCLREFNQSVHDALAFLSQAQAFSVVQPDGSHRHIGVRRVELLAGLALLRVYLAWEEFLESVFTRYMCRAKAASGFAPRLLYSPEPSISAAMTKLLALPPRRGYLDWGCQNTLTRASLFFDSGEPFATCLHAVAHTLEDVVIIRNRFAHRSDFATQKFHHVVMRWLGSVPRGITPGRFLLTTNPDPSAGGQMFIVFYANILLGAGRSIVS